MYIYVARYRIQNQNKIKRYETTMNTHTHAIALWLASRNRVCRTSVTWTAFAITFNYAFWCDFVRLALCTRYGTHIAHIWSANCISSRRDTIYRAIYMLHAISRLNWSKLCSDLCCQRSHARCALPISPPSISPSVFSISPSLSLYDHTRIVRGELQSGETDRIRVTGKNTRIFRLWLHETARAALAHSTRYNPIQLVSQYKKRRKTFNTKSKSKFETASKWGGESKHAHAQTMRETVKRKTKLFMIFVAHKFIVYDKNWLSKIRKREEKQSDQRAFDVTIWRIDASSAKDQQSSCSHRIHPFMECKQRKNETLNILSWGSAWRHLHSTKCHVSVVSSLIDHKTVRISVRAHLIVTSIYKCQFAESNTKHRIPASLDGRCRLSNMCFAYTFCCGQSYG